MAQRETGPRERELLAKANRVLPGGSLGNPVSDIIIDRGMGSHVWDVSGNEYIDYLLGSGPMLLGHSHPEVNAVVTDQLARGTTFFATNEHAILLAEEILRAVPCAEKVRFCSTGSEATMYAMRAARAFRGRDKILKFEGGFHGMNDYALMSWSPANPAPYPQAVPDSAGIPRAVQEQMLIAPFNDIETTSAIIDQHHEDIAGVIVEPFQRLIPPAPGFLQGLRELTERHQIPLIFDEVVTGFRFSYGGAQEYYGVTPDLCSLGKAVAGGFPLTAVVGKDEIMSHMDRSAVEPEEFMPQIGTLSGNPIAAVAGLKTLEILRREGTYPRLFATGEKIKVALQRLMDEADIPAKVIGIGPVFDVFFTDSDVTDFRSSERADSGLLARFTSLLSREGVFRGAEKFYVSTAHTEADVAQTISAFEAAIAQLPR